MTTKEIKQKAKESFNVNKGNHIIVSLIVTMALSVASSFSLLIGGVLSYGQYDYFLKVIRKEEVEIKNVFSGIEKFTTTLVENLLLVLKILLWSFLFIIPGIIKWHAYAMTWFILVDNPDMQGGEAHKKSEEMMKGHKMEFFKLQLSFIGWYILILLTFGIAGYYIQPYILLCNTEFYENLKNNTVELV